MKNNTKNTQIGIYIVLILALYLLCNFNFLESWWKQFYIICGGMTLYIFIELKNLYKKEKKLFFLNPIFISSITTFLLSLGGLTGFLLTYDGKFFLQGTTYMVDALYAEPQWMVKAVGYSFIGSIFMWIGYKTDLGSQLFIFYTKKLQYDKLIDTPLSYNKLFLLFLFAYGVKLYLYANGLYGYQQLRYDVFENSRLHVFQNLGSLLFAIIAYQYYVKKDKQMQLWFFISFVLELLFSLIHGARSTIIMFFVLVMIVRIVSGVKIKIKHAAYGFLIVLFALTFGAEFKHYLGSSAQKTDINSPLKAIESFFSSRQEIVADLERLNTAAEDQSGIKNISYYFAVGRFAYVGETALSIRHKDLYGLQDSDPSFLYYILTSPFFAIFPSYYFFNIKEPPWGGWYFYEVQKPNYISNVSIAFSPIGYLYFLGKLPAVMLGCFFYGVLLKFTNVLKNKEGVGYFVLFLALFSTVYTFDTSVHSIFLIFIRYTILFPIAYYLFFTKIK